MTFLSFPLRAFWNSCIIGVALVASSDAISGQEARPFSVAVLVGPTTYDLSGTGTSLVLAGEFDYVPVTAVVLEAGLTYFGYTAQSGDEVRFLFPEVSVQGQVPIGPVRPYVGGGVGRSIVIAGGRDNQLTLHVVGGLQVQLNSTWGMRGELRVRAIDPFGASMGDFAFGVTRAL